MATRNEAHAHLRRVERAPGTPPPAEPALTPTWWAGTRQLQAVFDHTPVPMWILDDAACYLAANPAAGALHGIPAGALIGRPVLDFLAPGNAARFQQTWQRFLREGRLEDDLPIRRADGAPQAVTIRATAHILPGYHLIVAHDAAPARAAAARIDRQQAQLAALRRIDQTRTASRDLHVVLDVILDQVLAQLSVDAAGVLLLDETTESLSYATSRGFGPEPPSRLRLCLGAGYAGRAALERRALHIPLLRPEGDLVRAAWIARQQFVSGYAVPLLANGQVRGVLELFHRAPLDLPAGDLDFLNTLADQAAIAIDNAALFAGQQRSNQELALAYETTLEGWSRALDLRDRETEGHTQRVTEMTVRLAQVLGLSAAELVHVRRGALLHDIGKMGIPDAILLKPGPLTGEEWAIMRRHPVYAYELLMPVAFLRPALTIPYCHHERWDGTGYPRGLQGTQIPWPARIFAVVDVWDALRSDRPYRPALPEAQVRAHIRGEAGTHFDPRVVAAFLDLVLPPI